MPTRKVSPRDVIGDFYWRESSYQIVANNSAERILVGLAERITARFDVTASGINVRFSTSNVLVRTSGFVAQIFNPSHFVYRDFGPLIGQEWWVYQPGIPPLALVHIFELAYRPIQQTNDDGHLSSGNGWTLATGSTRKNLIRELALSLNRR